MYKIRGVPIEEIDLSKLDEVQLTQLALTLEEPKEVLEIVASELTSHKCPCAAYDYCYIYHYAEHCALGIKWRDDGAAIEFLSKHFEIVDCTISPRVAGYTIDALEQSAISYLVEKWQHTFEPEPREYDSEEEGDYLQ